MELKEIVTVSGKNGLFKATKPTRTGMILKSMDAQKTRFVAGTQHRLSLLSEISMYVTTAEGNIALQDVLYSIFAAHGKNALPVSSKAEPRELTEFMLTVVPDYDSSRVYASDIKKLVGWYGILVEYAPEVLEKQEPEPEETQSVEPQPIDQQLVAMESQPEESLQEEKPEGKKKQEQESGL